jgi:hypothetical protein
LRYAEPLGHLLEGDVLQKFSNVKTRRKHGFCLRLVAYILTTKNFAEFPRAPAAPTNFFAFA